MGMLHGWTWDAYAAYDETKHDQKNYNAVLKTRVQNLLNAADGGNSICAGGFNPFGLAASSSISAACMNYMTKTAHSTEKLTQTQGQVLLQGPIFTLPAGDVHLALLASTRRNTYVYNPDPDLAAQNIEAVTASQPSRGKISVNEFAVQADVPVLKDQPFAESLDIGAAYRYSDYSTSGEVTSYEGDIRWHPVRNFLVRGGYQRAVRAPNIGELFSAASGAQIAFGTPPASVGDPCDVRSPARTGPGGAQVRALCLAQGIPASVIDSYTFPTTATAGVSQGNSKLEPEVADTYNFGVSWNSTFSSPWVSGLTASVDFYKIRIQKVISVVPGLSALSKCYNLDGSNPAYANANTFCSLLSRDSNGLLQTINTPYLNLGGLRTEGVDVQVNWKATLADIGVPVPGQIFAGTGIGYTKHFEIQTLPGTAFQDYVGTNTIATGAGSLGTVFPKVKALTTVGYSGFGATVGVRWRHMDAMKDVTSVTTPATPGVGVPAYDIYDVYATYDFGKRYQIRGGVTNIDDKALPIVASSQTSTDTATFDAVGRSFYVGLRANF
jgi:iron complex outermembrane receptor protein